MEEGDHCNCANSIKKGLINCKNGRKCYEKGAFLGNPIDKNHSRYYYVITIWNGFHTHPFHKKFLRNKTWKTWNGFHKIPGAQGKTTDLYLY